MPTQTRTKPLVVGVNSFPGFSGANAHALVREVSSGGAAIAFTGFADAASAIPVDAFDVCFAGHGRTLRQLLIDKTAENYYDIAYTAAYRRERLENVWCFRSMTSDKRLTVLLRFSQGETVRGDNGRGGLSRPGEVAFIYSAMVPMGRHGPEIDGRVRALWAIVRRFLDAAMLPVARFSIIEELQSGRVRISFTTQ